MPEKNTIGPTILWNELEGKKVKSNDGKKLGHVKKITQNHFLVEKGLVKKEVFGCLKIWVMLMTANIFG